MKYGDVMVLGSDGYIGWPLTLRLAEEGFNVMGVDAGFKRTHYKEMECQHRAVDGYSLVPIAGYDERKGCSTSYHRWWCVDASDEGVLEQAVNSFSPDVVIHLAEIGTRSFGMSDALAAQLTIHNNTEITTRLSYALKEQKRATYVVKAGTLENSRPVKDVCTASVMMSNIMLRVACRAYDLKATEVDMGLVWGLHSADTSYPLYNTRFDYDASFGPVVHRFMVQALAGGPITVYGDGTQVIPLIHLTNIIEVFLSAAKMARHMTKGEHKGIPCCAQMISVAEIADIVNEGLKLMGKKTVPVHMIVDPRNEGGRIEWPPLPKRAIVRDAICLTPDTAAEMMAALEPYIAGLDRRAAFQRDSWR